MKNLKSDFPILRTTVHSKPLIYLDSAATAQKPQIVIDTVNELHTTCNANIHRGIHHLAEQTTLLYEQARSKVRTFINAASDREIIFTSGATASINLVAHSFGQQFISQGDNIILSEMEHHSNIVPWQLVAARQGAQIRVIPFNDRGELELERLTDLIDSRTKIIALTQASNVLGTMPDLKQVVKIAHNHGIPVLVDGCQGVVHTPTDVQALDADFYCFSGHKLYGPTGIGVLYGKEKWLEQMPPFLGGGDMIARVSFIETTYAELPLKFEAGTSNYIGAIGLGTALDYLTTLDLPGYYQMEHSLGCEFQEKLVNSVPGVLIYGTAKDKCPVVSFTIDGTHPMDIGMIVDKLGVAIRTGTHCAEPIMAHFGIEAMCRASFGIYNDYDDVNVAIKAIQRAVSMLRS